MVRTKSKVWVIYNPNSTGNSQELASQTVSSLKNSGIAATSVATEHPGHAETIAKNLAQTHKNAIVISASGDGGYNEVVNGILRSTSRETACGVLPAGNANDHYHALHRGNLAKRILAQDIDRIDCIAVKRKKQTRYAHSYVGLGMTPQIGRELTKRKLTPIIEAWVVLRKIFAITPVMIKHDGKRYAYDHLVISNIAKMSKYIVVAPDSKADDGKLEFTAVRSGSFSVLLRHLLVRMVSKAASPAQISEYTFTCIRATTMQLDGEVIRLDAGETVSIDCKNKILNTIV